MSQIQASDLSDSSEHGDLAYVIYTSGSTGKPKGVMIQQCSVVNYTLALCEILETKPGWQYAMVSTLAADLGNTSVFCALASGGCVQVLDYEMVTSAEKMAKWVEQHPFDVLKIVPSHLSALLEDEHDKNLLPRCALVLGGEVLPAGLLEQVRELGSNCKVYNHYGPTETTVGVLVSSFGILGTTKEEKEGQKCIPLGKPITNMQVYILDQWMQVVPVGVTGELHVGGVGLAIGYVGQPEQTAERFVPNPFVEAVPCACPQTGLQLYRTGDLARYGEGGEIEFVGRRDSQIKLRGYRIELGEIEIVLKQHSNVRNSVVMLQEDQAGRPQLVGYVVLHKVTTSASADLRDFMRERLPEYMVPKTFVYLKFLPLTANGKVDRRRLTATNGEENYRLSFLDTPDKRLRTLVQPRDAIEFQLLQIWEEVLQIQPISVTDSFFALGGHSLLAVRLVSLVSKHFGQKPDLATLFRYPTIAEFAVILRQQVTIDNTSPLVAIHDHGAKPPFFCVDSAGGTAFCYVDLARCLGSDQPFYGLQAPERIGGEEGLGTVEELAAHYLAAIQTVQPQGPYLLGGWSAGGILAFEIAQQLQQQGHEVGLLALLDTSPPSAQEREKALEEEMDLGDAGVVKDLLHHFQIPTPENFDQRELAEQLTYAIEQAKKMHAIPADTSIELVRRYARTSMLTKHIVHLYVAKAYPHHIDYFACSQHSPVPNGSLEQTVSLDERDDTTEVPLQHDRLQIWRELATGGMEVHLVPGNHLTLVEEPHVQGLANKLKQRIDRLFHNDSGTHP